MNPIVWQATSFTGAAIALVAGSAWWLYRSPMRSTAAVDSVEVTSPRRAAWLALLLGLSALQMVSGGLWDASRHIQSGEIPAGADFLWAPHIMIYSAFLLSFVVAIVAIALVGVPAWRAGQRDPRAWVRRNPFLGAVALSSCYALASVPGDALWHALYGIDLTAWSPPHVLIGTMICTVIVCAVGLLVSAPFGARVRPRVDAGVVVLLALMLGVIYMIGVLEWELPGQSPAVLARPLWLYPVVGASLGFVASMLARGLVHRRYAATSVMLVFSALRIVAMWVLGAIGLLAPAVPLVMIVGALGVDLVASRTRSAHGVRAMLATSVAYTAGVALLVLPALGHLPYTHGFHRSDYVLTVVVLLPATLVLQLPLRAATRWLGGAQATDARPGVADATAQPTPSSRDRTPTPA